MRIAVASVAAVLLGLLIGCSDTGDDGAPSPTAPTHVDGRAPTQEELIGTWRPVTLFGETVTRMIINGEPLDLHFITQTEEFGWKAYNGCNWTSAFAEVDKAGGFKTVSDPVTTLRGCRDSGDAVSRNVDAVKRAKRVGLRGTHLVFLNAGNEVIGEYVQS